MHVEAVTGIVGRADVLCTVLVLLAALALARAIRCRDAPCAWSPCHTRLGMGREEALWSLACVGLVGLAALSKETGITAILPLVIFELLSSTRHPTAATAAAAASATERGQDGGEGALLLPRVPPALLGGGGAEVWSWGEGGRCGWGCWWAWAEVTWWVDGV